MDERIASHLDRPVQPVLAIDAGVSTSGAHRELVEKLEAAGPYGVVHERPRLALADQQVVDVRTVGRGHLAVRLRGADGSFLRAIAFRAAEGPLGEAVRRAGDATIHVAGSLERDDYRGRRGAVLHLEDVALPD